MFTIALSALEELRDALYKSTTTTTITTIACCLVVFLGLDSVSGWLVVLHTYLCYFRL